MKKLLLIFSLSIISLFSWAQTADDKVREAVRLMDTGNIGESIILLNEAIKENPDSYIYQYELSYAYYLKKDYKEALKLAKKLEKHKDVNFLLYTMIGNIQDEMGEPKKALKTYEDGLKKFPDAGMLYLNKGVTLFRENLHDEALAAFEKGIDVAPKYPSNYYWVSKLFCLYTENKMWGLIYGEIFMNLEVNSPRTEEISKLLYDTYKNGITIKNDTSFSVSLYPEEHAIVLDEKKMNDAEYLLKALKIPYGIEVFNSSLSAALIPVPEEINMTTLNTIRQNFVRIYDEKWKESYPHVLFEYQKQIQDLGLMNAYNHWILMQGEPEQFVKWRDENEVEWDRFVNWFMSNPIPISHENKLIRAN